MGKSLNRTELIGNLGQDPEIRSLPDGTQVASFSLATSETYRDKQSGEKKDVTTWHNVVAFAGLGEISGKYLHKGSRIWMSGRGRTRSWDDKSTGTKQYRHEIRMDDLVMLDGPSTSPSNNGPSDQSQQSYAPPTEDFDDDIPF